MEQFCHVLLAFTETCNFFFLIFQNQSAVGYVKKSLTQQIKKCGLKIKIRWKTSSIYKLLPDFHYHISTLSSKAGHTIDHTIGTLLSTERADYVVEPIKSRDVVPTIAMVCHFELIVCIVCWYMYIETSPPPTPQQNAVLLPTPSQPTMWRTTWRSELITYMYIVGWYMYIETSPPRQPQQNVVLLTTNTIPADNAAHFLMVWVNYLCVHYRLVHVHWDVPTSSATTECRFTDHFPHPCWQCCTLPALLVPHAGQLGRQSPSLAGNTNRNIHI